MTKKQLKKLFKSNNIEFNKQYYYIQIEKNKIRIIIYNNDKFIQMIPAIKNYGGKQRKNCFIIKYKEENIKTNIYFNEDYINFTIRNNILNKLLND